MVQMKPIDLKEVAKRFTEKYYPQWMSRFDRIWEMFEKTDLNKIVSDPAKSQYLQGNAFGIAGTAEPESKEYMSGIAIVAFTYQGAKDKDSISNDEVKKRISLVPNLKIIPEVQEKLENVISEMLPLMVEGAEELQKERPYVQKDKMEYSHFTKKYQVIIQPGLYNNKGLLIINNRQIGISSRECALCDKMVNRLKRDWFTVDIERDRGWVSYDAFIGHVKNWKNAKDAIGETVIINAINILNKKIETILKCKGLNNYLIQNGNDKLFNWPKNYRFRVHPDFLSIE